MYQVPQNIPQHRTSCHHGCAIGGSIVALLFTLLWYSLLPTLAMGYLDDVGPTWVNVQPRDQWMRGRGVELLIVVMSCVLLLYSSVRRWTGWRSILLLVALAAIVLVWFRWGKIVFA